METRLAIIPTEEGTAHVIEYATPALPGPRRATWLEVAALSTALGAFAFYGLCALFLYLIGPARFGPFAEAAGPTMLGVALLEFPISVVAVAQQEGRKTLSWVALALSVAFGICAMIGVVVMR